MLPDSLIGPQLVSFLDKEELHEFTNRNRVLYPRLNETFLSQVCFQHPDLFNENFPYFDPEKYSAEPMITKMGWVYENLRYDYNEELNFWFAQYDSFKENDFEGYLKKYMLANKTWPEPPVIVEASLAIKLGMPENKVGKPYYLIEGTRRTSYARRMMQLGLIDKNSTAVLVILNEIGS